MASFTTLLEGYGKLVGALYLTRSDLSHVFFLLLFSPPGVVLGIDVGFSMTLTAVTVSRRRIVCFAKAPGEFEVNHPECIVAG